MNAGFGDVAGRCGNDSEGRRGKVQPWLFRTEGFQLIKARLVLVLIAGFVTDEAKMANGGGGKEFGIAEGTDGISKVWQRQLSDWWSAGIRAVCGRGDGVGNFLEHDDISGDAGAGPAAAEKDS